jgi:dTDP-4-dehydrorhamnose reductase
MKPTILLIGRTGQIGADLKQLLPQIGNVFAPGREELDLADLSQIRRAIAAVRPGVIVNAGAYTAVDQAESDVAAAQAVNAEAPRILADEARRVGALLVHYSTDYVFDGEKRSPYVEDDSTHPLNVYGETKLEGEIAIRDSGAAHLILRTSWVYATRGKNFLLTAIRLATQKEELRIVRDQNGAPTWSREIAAATVRILGQLLNTKNGALAAVRGTYHMTAGGQTNWAEFAKAILGEARLLPPSDSWLAAATSEKPLIARGAVSITTAEYPTAARRPAYSVLSNARLAETFGIFLPNWQEQLKSAFARRNEPSA